MRDAKRRPYLIAILLAAFALRVYRLDAQSIWVDESISLHLVNSSLAEIVADRATNIHPPLYFFLLKGWTGLAGAGVFPARFLSVMASVLQVALVYRVARRRLGRPAAWIGATLTALSPLSVIYAQEIRMYAMLPLVTLTILGLTPGWGRLTQRTAGDWLLLGLVELVGLHLHYTVILLVVYVNLWSIVTLWRGRRWTALRRWMMTQAAVGLGCVPWLITVLAHWPAIRARALAVTQPAQAAPPGYVAAQAWAFHWTGMAGALGRPAMRLLVAAIAVLLFLQLVLVFLQPRAATARRTAAALAAHWLIPVGTALLLWTVRSFAHPRYLMVLTPGLTLLAAYAMQESLPKLHTKERAIRGAGRAGHVTALLLASALLALSFLGVQTLFFDPTFAKDDMRTVARYLEEVTGASDLILVPDGDWTLPILYGGEASIEMPGMPDDERTWADLERWTLEARRAFLVSYPKGLERDPQGLVPFALEKAGALHDRRRFEGIRVRAYELERPVERPTLTPIEARFGPLTLTEGWVELTTPADTALTLALRWRVDELRWGELAAEAACCHVTIHLLDIDGWSLTARDEALVDGESRPADRWPAGEETTTYHRLPIPPGTPPLTYTVALGLYGQGEEGPVPLDVLDSKGAPQGQRLDLATVRLTRAMGIVGDPYDAADTPTPLARPVDLGDGLRLVGAALDRTALGSGQSLFVTLHWEAPADEPGARLPDLRPRLALVQGGEALDAAASAPALGRYPTDHWQAGETVVEHRRLTAPATAAEGPADVVLALGDRRLVLGQVEINAQARTFEPPPIEHALDARFGRVARLLGYDLASETVGAGEPIPITLYWQALEEAAEADYTVFTHILADAPSTGSEQRGRLVGQHDGPPAGGSRPTTGWVAGEIVVDRHAMTLREAYAGPARIEVGLYERDTLERVGVEGGMTSVLLPTPVTILEP